MSPSQPAVTRTTKWTVADKTSVTPSGDSTPTGVSVSFVNNGTNANDQLTAGKSETWTFTGLSGYTISSVIVHLKNNASKGNGSLSSTNNGVAEEGCAIAEITELGNTYTTMEALTNGSITVNGTFVITISATVNSVYCDYIEITYRG